MQHQTFIDWLELAPYEELDRDQRRMLDEHLRSCEQCRERQAQTKSMHRVLKVRTPKPVTAKMLNDARRSLRLALYERRERRSLVAGFLDAVDGWFAPPVRVLAGSAALLIVGFVSGSLVFQSAESGRMIDPTGIVTTADPGAVTGEGEINIQNLRFLDRDVRTGDIEVTFESVIPYRLRGNINDERIQRVLAHALVSDENPGMRLRAVNMIAGQNETRSSVDQNVKSALISALKYDRNFSVRREALAVLQNYLPDADAVQAILYVLANEKNTGMKVAAINALDMKKLAGGSASADVRKALQLTVDSEENNYVRIKAQAALQENKP